MRKPYLISMLIVITFAATTASAQSTDLVHDESFLNNDFGWVSLTQWNPQAFGTTSSMEYAKYQLHLATDVCGTFLQAEYQRAIKTAGLAEQGRIGARKMQTRINEGDARHWDSVEAAKYYAEIVRPQMVAAMNNLSNTADEAERDAKLFAHTTLRTNQRCLELRQSIQTDLETIKHIQASQRHQDQIDALKNLVRVLNN